MTGEDKGVVYGMWVNPFVKKVKLALKIRDIPFGYVGEDLKNKNLISHQIQSLFKRKLLYSSTMKN